MDEQDPNTATLNVKQRFRQKKTLIISAVIIVLLIVVGVITLAGRSPSSPTNNKGAGNTQDQTYLERAEYGKQPGSIGDPGALVEVQVGTPAFHQGDRVVQACDVLHLEDVRSHGWLIAPRDGLGAITRSYFDGAGGAALPIDTRDLPRNTNVCKYLIEREAIKGYVEAEVFQPLYAHSSVLKMAADTVFATATEAEGFRVSVLRPSQSDPTLKRYYVGSENLLVRLNFYIENDASADQKALALTGQMAKRLRTLATKPSGPPRYAYESPVFKGDYANACEISASSDFKLAFGNGASPVVEEEISSAIGVVDYGKGSVNEIKNTCKRQLTGASERQVLTIKTISFESNAAAQQEMDYTIGQKRPEMLTGIGDQALFVSDLFAGTQPSAIEGGSGNKTPVVMFRKGRVIVQLQLFWSQSQGLSIGGEKTVSIPKDQYIQKLTPVGQAILKRLETKRF